jgi:hypothetical protein
MVHYALTVVHSPNCSSRQRGVIVRACKKHGLRFDSSSLAHAEAETLSRFDGVSHVAVTQVREVNVGVWAKGARRT